MKCGIQGCPGQYEPRAIVHTVKRGADILVFENVPAEVHNVRSDVPLAPGTVRHLGELVMQPAEPGKHAPVYEYA